MQTSARRSWLLQRQATNSLSTGLQRSQWLLQQLRARERRGSCWRLSLTRKRSSAGRKAPPLPMHLECGTSRCSSLFTRVLRLSHSCEADHLCTCRPGAKPMSLRLCSTTGRSSVTQSSPARMKCWDWAQISRGRPPFKHCAGKLGALRDLRLKQLAAGLYTAEQVRSKASLVQEN